MMRHALRFASAKSGAVLSEFALVGPLVILLTLLVIEMGALLWNWNSMAKAAQVGARLAAVSAPISSDLSTMTGLGGGVIPGGAMPYFVRACTGATASCTNGGAYNAAAMNWIVFGSNGACGPNDPRPGMCDVANGIQPQNVAITYEQTGLGFAGRPGGPVPSITLRVSGLAMNTPILGAFSTIFNFTIPPFATTVTGEDMRTSTP